MKIRWDIISLIIGIIVIVVVGYFAWLNGQKCLAEHTLEYCLT